MFSYAYFNKKISHNRKNAWSHEGYRNLKYSKNPEIRKSQLLKTLKALEKPSYTYLHHYDLKGISPIQFDIVEGPFDDDEDNYVSYEYIIRKVRENIENDDFSNVVPSSSQSVNLDEVEKFVKNLSTTQVSWHRYSAENFENERNIWILAEMSIYMTILPIIRKLRR